MEQLVLAVVSEELLRVGSVVGSALGMLLVVLTLAAKSHEERLRQLEKLAARIGRG
jgi:hypothetical protein